ncbi:MAG: hypothetical protein U0941_12635 [Planctomycetaceae bacterium]
MKTWKITLCLTLLVAASILLGVWIGYRAALRSKNNQQVIGQSWHKRAIKSLNDKLSLTDQQRTRVDQLVSAAVKEFQGLKETTLSREREIIQQLVKAVEAELTDEQRQTFATMKPKDEEITLDLLRVEDTKSE